MYSLYFVGNSVESKVSSNLASVSLSTEAVTHANDGEKVRVYFTVHFSTRVE